MAPTPPTSIAPGPPHSNVTRIHDKIATGRSITEGHYCGHVVYEGGWVEWAVGVDPVKLILAEAGTRPVVWEPEAAGS